MLEKLAIRVAYQNRTTRDAFVVNPNGPFVGHLKWRPRYLPRISGYRGLSVPAPYGERVLCEIPGVGDLNDFNQFFGNDPWP